MSRLPVQCRLLLNKAKDSALQAISVFNDPRSTFRTGNFTVLMTIAWTALLHSNFEKQKVKYYYKKPNGRYDYVDGERKVWELGESVTHFFVENDPVRKNIELFIKLRNKIEHRNLPGIDNELTGESQALVLNFEDWLIKNYGSSHTLIDTMFVPIQLTKDRHSLPKTQSELRIIEFIKNYRNLLVPEVINSQHFSFKAFLVPKIGNHRSSSDVAIEFVRYNENDPEEMKNYDKVVVGIKDKYIPVANTNLYRPKTIMNELHKIGVNKSMNWHTEMWRRFKVRPPRGSDNKKNTKTDYCVYDEAHQDYLYTKKWIEFLSQHSKLK